MEKTYLLQSLKAPYKNEMHMKVAQAFGGGMLMLSNDAWKLMGNICSIHNMGAAEYEFGTLPNVLNNIVKSNLCQFDMVIKKENIKRNRSIQSAQDKHRRDYIRECKLLNEKPMHATKWKRLNPIKDIEDKSVYVVCPEDMRASATNRIVELAKDKDISIKCGNSFPWALDPSSKYDEEYKGWIELTNGFLFFLDKDMRDNFWTLFNSIIKD